MYRNGKLTATVLGVVAAAAAVLAGWRPLAAVGGNLDARLRPGLCTNGNGVLHTVSSGQGQSQDCGVHFYVRSTDGGVVWPPGRSLFTTYTNTVEMHDHAITCSGPNVYGCGWQAGVHPIVPGVYVRRSTDDGATWADSEPTLVVGGTVFQVGGQAALMHGAEVVVVYRYADAHPESCDIAFKKSTDGGITWSVQAYVAQQPREQTEPHAVVADTTIHVVWADNRYVPGFYDIWYNVSPDGGTTWLHGTSGQRVTTVPSLHSSRVPQVGVGGG
jgi:hypothetical protein